MANGVIVSPGNEDGIILPKYFNKGQNIKTGELIDFKSSKVGQRSTKYEKKEKNSELFVLNNLPGTEGKEWTIVMKEEEKLNEQSLKVSEDEAYNNILEEILEKKKEENFVNQQESMGEKLKTELKTQWIEKDNLDELNLLPIGEADIENEEGAVQESIEQEYDLSALQRACPEIGVIIKYLEEGRQPRDAKVRRRLEFEKDHFYIKDKILWHKQPSRGRVKSLQKEVYQRVIPISLKKKLLEGYHSRKLCHAGFDRTYMAITRSYYWAGMYKDIKNYTKRCLDCQASKSHSLNKALLKPLEIVEGFGRKLHCDFVGPILEVEGFKYVFTVVDSFTTWTWLFPTKNMTAETAVKCLVQVVKEAGCFLTLVSDQGQSLIGKVMKGFCDLFNIKKIRTSPFCPKSNARVERMHGTLANCLRTTCEDNTKWLSQLPFIEMALRASPIRGLGVSPFELLHGGKGMLLPVDTQVVERKSTEENT